MFTNNPTTNVVNERYPILPNRSRVSVWIGSVNSTNTNMYLPILPIHTNICRYLPILLMIVSASIGIRRIGKYRFGSVKVRIGRSLNRFQSFNIGAMVARSQNAYTEIYHVCPWDKGQNQYRPLLTLWAFVQQSLFVLVDKIFALWLRH